MATNFGKLNFSTAFKPTSAFPLNANCYFESYSDAVAAAATAEEAGSFNTLYYFGMEIVVVDSSKNTATLYLIQPDKTLKEVGTVPTGDSKTIDVINGVIKMHGITDAATGSQPVMQADGTISWIVPSTTTVEGLQTAVEDLKQNKADKTSVYTKEEVDSKLSSVYKYCGSVDNYSDLPLNLNESDAGKVYNVVNADETHKVKAGDNLAWNGTAWDNLGGDVDLSSYSTTEQMNAALDEKVDKAEGSRLVTNEEIEKWNEAEKNVISSVDEDQFDVSETGKLTLLDIAMSKITGLSDALNAKADKTQVASDISAAIAAIPTSSIGVNGLVKGTENFDVNNGEVESISTDLLSQGTNKLIFDGGVFTD